MKEITKSWYRFAQNDLAAAKKLLDDESLGHMVLFHCQQSIEKIIKAHLEESEIEIPKIHNLIRLNNLLPSDFRTQDESFMEILEELNSVYIDSRYPGDLGLLPSGYPTQKKVNSIFEKTILLFRFFENYLK